MLATGQVLAQSKAVSGTVKSQQGEPLTGVTILIEGTTQGTSTDAQGAFTLQAKPDDMLAVSYLGYKSQRVKVGTRTKLEVVLTEDQNLMDEVVVVGYGTQRRRNIVGAVENISGEVLENRPNAYLLRSIQGQIPGLNITMADGKPSRSASINIRANTQSIGARLIDGVGGRPDGDESRGRGEHLGAQDASSTAVYGARGAFGVVLVTTKSARKDKISVDYSGSVSIISETVRPKYETDSQTWYDNYMTAYVGYSHHLPTGINNFFPWTQSWEDEYKKRMNDPTGAIWNGNSTPAANTSITDATPTGTTSSTRNRPRPTSTTSGFRAAAKPPVSSLRPAITSRTASTASATRNSAS